MAKIGAPQTAGDQEWEDFKKQITEVVSVFGVILFTPVIILIGVGYGIRAGVIAGVEKTLEMLKSFGT